jgi:isopenicillin N synthase-like dioxygenase
MQVLRLCVATVLLLNQITSSAALTNATAVPVIDITPLRTGDESARRAVAAQIGAACREIGFFAIVGHGVPDSIIDAAWSETASFFNMPVETKLAAPRMTDE